MTGQRERILEQYASPAGRSLYRHVMGDGSDHIHYGLYAGPGTPMREALPASCRRLLELALAHGDGTAPERILDLGAGAGGPAKCLAAWTRASLTCVDLCDAPLRDLDAWAESEGVASRLRTWRGSFAALPADWAGAYDLAWSQDALCHAPDRPAVFAEARRVLRPGGTFAFTDILLAEDAPEAEAAAFTAVNAVQHLGTPSGYLRELREAGFGPVATEDWTAHLPANFRRMRDQIDRFREAMLAEGVPAGNLDRFAEALDRRLRWAPGSVLTWRAFACRRG